MSKILVTGGLGFIGLHTVVELVEAGYHPVIVDDLSNSNKGILEQLKKIVGTQPAFYQVDLTDERAVDQLAVKEPDIRGIVHFACAAGQG